jgi:glutamate/tyrosine decarboxylase-like PLP-dependent enzyme
MLDLDPEARAALLGRLAQIVERATQGAGPTLASDAPLFDLAATSDPLAVLEAAADALERGVVRTGSPAYFGPFNPAPSFMSVIAEALVAAYNPQLAIESHAPWAVASERALIESFGARFGLPACEGTFTSGGAESNFTAVLAALVRAWPDVLRDGVRSLDAQPVLYVSSEGHATIARAARLAGLGKDAVRVIPADASLRLKTSTLREAIARDRSEGRRPFLVVATAGTTSAGTIDPIGEIAVIAERAGCSLHVDAAWGGLAAFVPEARSWLDGIERADSITFDAHKALSAPMTAGVFLTRHAGLLARVFHESSGYMPRDTEDDPYARSFAWSRRFQGLKVLLTIATASCAGVAQSLRTQIELGERLRVQLRERGWTLANDTPLPVVCFVDPTVRSLDAVAREVNARGAWISATKLSTGVRALRACIASHRTTAEHVDALVDALDAARATLRA